MQIRGAGEPKQLLRTIFVTAWPRLLLLLTVWLLAPGCIMIPIPHEGRHVTVGWKDKAIRLQAAAATRAQVKRELGPPAGEFCDLRVLGYQWWGLEWSLFFIAYGPSGGGGYSHYKPVEHRLLWMAFDDEDRLMCWKLTDRSESKTMWEQAARWRESKTPPLNPTPLSRFVMNAPPPAKAVVHVLWDQGRSDAPVLAVSIDGRDRAAIRKGCFTTFTLEPGRHQISVSPRPLILDLADGEVCFLEVRPDKDKVFGGAALLKCSEREAVVRLGRLTFCR